MSALTAELITTLLDTSERNLARYRRTYRPLARTAFDRTVSRAGRNDGPALLFDLYFGRTLDLSRSDMAGVVADVWSDAEYPARAFDDPQIWTHLFVANGYSHDGEKADRPTESVVLYRGCTHEGRFGMSWTSDVEMARRFAYGGLRGRAQGQVYTAVVAPEHLLAYIGERSGRGESEYVVDPSGLSDHNVTVLSGGAR
ncbi:hypothetical protein [Mycolicibacterium brisbanense]|uniref:Uncharacterized protein n=1 Tax=Mycolicibacterium brisbanense TaxID=146020 RepID=A0A100W2M2_9MYCO|nr:hypothetical protein [Mycolicibacterium brisbanense]MCV7158459.1 hypothetical protein [Mycolicibacterium brisbanense]GAS90489.1 uncharacterized protein RMCB_4585 [Mycolicibacterium brisbanense]